MKTTSKILLAAMALCIISSSSVLAKGKGSDDARFSAGVELALPMGTFGDQSGMGFGASLRYEMPMGDNLGLTGTVGYLTFGKKTFGTGPYSVDYTNSFIPIIVGAKYYFTEQQNGFYGSFGIGITMFHSSFTQNYPAVEEVKFGNTVIVAASPAHTVEASGNSSEFSFVPGVGYHLDNLDFGLGYNIVSATGGSLSYLGIRAAYVFGGK